MAVVFEEISLKGLHKADLKQLLDILVEHDRVGDYKGDMDLYYERSDRLINWLTRAVDYAYSEGVVMPKEDPECTVCRL